MRVHIASIISTSRKEEIPWIVLEVTETTKFKDHLSKEAHFFHK